jgi:hypothetical protein
MTPPNDVAEKAKRINDYLEALMNFTESLSDDHVAPRDVLRFMSRDILDDWDVLKRYLERSGSRPTLATISVIKDD